MYVPSTITMGVIGSTRATMSMEIEYERQVLKSASTNIYGIALDSEMAPDARFYDLLRPSLKEYHLRTQSTIRRKK